MRDSMGRCGCGMMIGCGVKSGEIAQSIKNTRREGRNEVGIKLNENGNLIDK